MSETATQLNLFDTNTCNPPPNEKWRPVPPVKRGTDEKNDSVTSLDEGEATDVTESSEVVTESSSKPCRISEAAISCYKPRGEARGGFEYFRFSYRDGKRVKHIHIPGGNVHCQRAVANRNVVRAMIKCGDSVEEILEQIEEWRKG